MVTVEKVWCENPAHGGKWHAHPETKDCVWPHFTGPSSPSPSAVTMRDLPGHGNTRER